jgi:serine/threonine protein kinase
VKGRILAGKYRLVDELGRGGMGSVWRADHVELRSVVAVKLIDPSLAQSAEGRSRFLREARAAGALRSNHVVQVYDYGVDEGIPFLVMELLEGESLAARLERKGRLTLAELQPVVRQVGRALAKAHAAGIVHRDLKPENIFICTEGDSELVKVLDFGIAKVESNIAVSVQTQTGLVLGTPYYMSPEQAEGRRALDSRSDLWSLGVITYECLLGQRPFDGENLAQLILAICAEDPPVPSSRGNVPAGFDQWFLRAVARRVELRFATIQELSDSFAGLDDRHAWESTLGITTDPAVEPSNSPAARPQAESGEVGSASAGQPLAIPLESKAMVPARSDASPPAPSTSGATLGAEVAVPVAIHRTAATDPSRRRLGIRYALAAVLSLGTVLIGAVVLAVGGTSLWQSSQDEVHLGQTLESSSTESQGTRTSQETVAPAPIVRGPTNTGEVASTSVNHHPSWSALDVAPAHDSATASSAKPQNASAPATRPREVSTVAAPITVPSTTRDNSRENAGLRPTQTTPTAAAGLYCVMNAMSGRVQRASVDTAGSFPCYVSTISGQLKRKN